MSNHPHQTALTQFVEANGIRFAYRRFGKSGGVPLVFNQHFTGTMDHWDPAVTDGLAKQREVIVFNNAGVSSSSGAVPTTFEEMGANAVAFIRALRLTKVDVLGFSIGVLLRRKSRARPPIWSGASSWSGRGRVAVKVWLLLRPKRSGSSAPLTIRPMRSGSPSTSLGQRQAKPRAASSSSVSGGAPRTAIPR